MGYDFESVAGEIRKRDDVLMPIDYQMTHYLGLGKLDWDGIVNGKIYPNLGFGCDIFGRNLEPRPDNFFNFVPLAVISAEEQGLRTRKDLALGWLKAKGIKPSEEKSPYLNGYFDLATNESSLRSLLTSAGGGFSLIAYYRESLPGGELVRKGPVLIVPGVSDAEREVVRAWENKYTKFSTPIEKTSTGLQGALRIATV